MAQYIAEDPQRLFVRPEKPLFSPASGEKMGSEKRLFAQFRRGEAPGWAVEVAIREFPLARMPASGVTVQQWLSFLDTVAEQHRYGWTDEERGRVERSLETTFAFMCRRVEAPRLAAPWPDIEKLRPVGRRTPALSAEKLVETAVLTGFALGDVVAYLRQEGWPAEVVELVEARLAEEKPGEEEPVALVEA